MQSLCSIRRLLLFSSSSTLGRQVQRLEHELGVLAQFDLALVSRGLDRILVHRHIFGTGDDEIVDPAEPHRLVDALFARPLYALGSELLHPDASTAGPTAERV